MKPPIPSDAMNAVKTVSLGYSAQKPILQQENSILAALTDQRRKLSELEEAINRLRSCLDAVSRPPTVKEQSPPEIKVIPGGSQVWTLIQDSTRDVVDFTSYIDEMIERLEVQ